MEILPGRPSPLGATLEESGTNFAVASEIAEQVVLCLFDAAGAETRLPLPALDDGVWHGFVPGVRTGQRYGYRVTGPYDPARGLRCNPAKLLLDPYAKATDGELVWGECLFGFSGRTCCCACSPPTSPGTCARCSRRSLSPIIRNQSAKTR